MIEYFMLRGQDHVQLVNLTETEKDFHIAVMIREQERENERYKNMIGTSK